MSDPAVEFASLLCSRLCHDLLSPVGALNNGLELLADETDPEMQKRVMELLTESARVSAEKLKFFRLAFGAAGGFAGEVDARDIKGAIEGVLGGPGSKTMIGWHVTQPTLSKRAAKVLLNLALIAGDALVRGGQLDIGAEGEEVVVRAEGPRLATDAEILATLSGASSEEPSSRTAAAWLVRRLAEEEGGSVQVGQEDGVLLFGASLVGAPAPAA
ncbi:histidine phosphotransferase family protein [Sphingomonas naphthae]|uniref:Histidine phosphotransferase family protein n=1 Tax=Sphingomonas naphthae TaxID=1813468 RepID=A0ABY7TFG5_9SPHN|nr:histidine phosphotransferase family protein [Sphingomonas naphthae]WCT71987.1 histidine phosphotransferase family protein [Sphingomonas naphthae]